MVELVLAVAVVGLVAIALLLVSAHLNLQRRHRALRHQLARIRQESRSTAYARYFREAMDARRLRSVK